MFVSLQFRLELKKEDKEKLIKLMRKQSSAIRAAYRRLLINPVQSLLASSEGSPPLPYSWKGLAHIGGRSVG